MCFAGYYGLLRVPNRKWKVVVLVVYDILRPINNDVVWKAKTACPARIYGFTTSILKSLDCDPFKLIGSHRCDLITNRTILCSSSHHSSQPIRRLYLNTAAKQI